MCGAPIGATARAETLDMATAEMLPLWLLRRLPRPTQPHTFMKLTSHSLLVAAALFATAASSIAAEPEAAPVPAAPTMVMLADLRGTTATVYGYGSWKDHLNPSANGMVVQGAKGAQGDGGLCGNLTPNYDLSGATWVEVALGVGQTNEGGTVVVGLSDADGTLVTARIRVDQIVPQQPVWFRVPLTEFHTVGGEQAGKDPGMDWTKIGQWHVQGDWSTKKPYQVVVIAVRARR